MSGLTVDLETRDRIKIVSSRMIAGTVQDGKVQMTMRVSGSLGNCPKYISKKEISPASVEKARCTNRGLPLSAEALEHLDQAGMFFHSTTNGESMDTNIRGGMPGFVRVMKNEADQVVLIYPECTQISSLCVTTGYKTLIWLQTQVTDYISRWATSI